MEYHARSSYLDFRKAFDSVSHRELLLKLGSFGISGELWSWFRAYLSLRRQMVSINGEHSRVLPVTSGVPQGSILGALLLLIYVNDLPLSALLTKLLMFADDTKCISLISDDKDCVELQSVELNQPHCLQQI